MHCVLKGIFKMSTTSTADAHFIKLLYVLNLLNPTSKASSRKSLEVVKPPSDGQENSPEVRVINSHSGELSTNMICCHLFF